jgi:hypothetical protein
MAMPEVPEEIFMSGLNQLFTQPEETGLKKEMETMYIRPL